MIFLTFNDKIGGIYRSQVIDVIQLISEDQKVVLVAFVPWGAYKETKKELKELLPEAKVYPILFGLKRWKWNRFLLKRIRKKLGAKSCISRGPLACSLAMDSGFQKVCYDGRAAVKAEIQEFDVVGDHDLSKDFIEAEKRAVQESDFRISVSNELVNYWEKEFNYSENNHVIIPCTLSRNFELVDEQKVTQIRQEIGIQEEDIVFVFSGGNAGWNSLNRTFELFRPALKKNPNYKLILLTGSADYIETFQNEFPNQVFRYWLAHDEVKNYLALGDYGLLIREDKITNNVASPVKFAEYLSLGLNILISSNVKDYAAFIKDHKCGVIVEQQLPVLDKVSDEQREINKNLANKFLSKESEIIRSNYSILMSNLKQ